MNTAQSAFPIRRVARDRWHYFFGYYNKSNWDAGGRLLLANQVPWRDARLTPDLVASVGYFDLARDDGFQVVGETRAWNWQMGCQLQWLGGAPGRELIYNVRTDDGNVR